MAWRRRGRKNALSAMNIKVVKVVREKDLRGCHYLYSSINLYIYVYGSFSETVHHIFCFHVTLVMILPSFLGGSESNNCFWLCILITLAVLHIGSVSHNMYPKCAVVCLFVRKWKYEYLSIDAIHLSTHTCFKTFFPFLLA